MVLHAEFFTILRIEVEAYSMRNTFAYAVRISNKYENTSSLFH